MTPEVGELVRLFGRLGFTAFGGPAAHIAMIHDEVVTRRGWLDEQRFLDLIGVTNLIPGPNSTEMTMHIGHERAGWRGLLAAGVSFILPAALIVLGLAWVYVEYGDTPSGEGILYGIKPVVVVVVLQALFRLGRTALVSRITAFVGVAAAGAYLLGVNELVVLAVGGLLVLALRTAADGRLLSVAPIAALTAGDDPIDVGRLLFVFLKVGALLYGSGYVLLAFLRNDLVEGLGVMTDRQLLDAIAIGQFTPGPLFTTATFIGYLLGGFPGALVATAGIFLPSFLFVGLVTPLARRIRNRVWTGSLLDGVNAAALGLMAGVTVHIGAEAVVDPVTLGIGAIAGLLMWKTRLNGAWLVTGGALAGFLITAFVSPN